MREWIKSVLLHGRDLLFPRKCAACACLLDWYGDVGSVFCPSCAEKWEEETRQTCNICMRPVRQCGCMTALMEKGRCKGLRKLVYYRHAVPDAVQNRLIFHVKRVRNRETPMFLASALLPALEELIGEIGDASRACMSYTPRSHAAISESGVDQARELAMSLSRLSGIPLVSALKRSRYRQKQQKRMLAGERLKNAEQAFVLRDRVDLDGKCVILVDDIVTTGASMAVCASLLRRGGAKKVYCLAVATDDVNRDRL